VKPAVIAIGKDSLRTIAQLPFDLDDVNVQYVRFKRAENLDLS